VSSVTTVGQRSADSTSTYVTWVSDVSAQWQALEYNRKHLLLGHKNESALTPCGLVVHWLTTTTLWTTQQLHTCLVECRSCGARRRAVLRTFLFPSSRYCLNVRVLWDVILCRWAD